MTKSQFNLKSLMFAVLIAAVLIWSVLSTIDRTNRNFDATRSAYGAQLVAYMCVDHMKTSNQTWPKNWGDLKDNFKPALARSGQTLEWTFSDLKKCVDVNWYADLNQLRFNANSNPIIWIANAPERKCYMTSPNEIVSKYLASTDSDTQ